MYVIWYKILCWCELYDLIHTLWNKYDVKFHTWYEKSYDMKIMYEMKCLWNESDTWPIGDRTWCEKPSRVWILCITWKTLCNGRYCVKYEKSPFTSCSVKVVCNMKCRSREDLRLAWPVSHGRLCGEVGSTAAQGLLRREPLSLAENMRESTGGEDLTRGPGHAGPSLCVHSGGHLVALWGRRCRGTISHFCQPRDTRGSGLPRVTRVTCCSALLHTRGPSSRQFLLALC